MDLILELQVKSSYGQTRIYPINEIATKLATLLGRKTFTKADLTILKELGFKLKWVPIEIAA